MWENYMWFNVNKVSRLPSEIYIFIYVSIQCLFISHYSITRFYSRGTENY